MNLLRPHARKVVRSDWNQKYWLLLLLLSARRFPFNRYCTCTRRPSKQQNGVIFENLSIAKMPKIWSFYFQQQQAAAAALPRLWQQSIHRLFWCSSVLLGSAVAQNTTHRWNATSDRDDSRKQCHFSENEANTSNTNDQKNNYAIANTTSITTTKLYVCSVTRTTTFSVIAGWFCVPVARRRGSPFSIPWQETSTIHRISTIVSAIDRVPRRS